jgi:predicted 3-demethylubiquinone-9 3-methyltransferase (glyoxalase superfamily)
MTVEFDIPGLYGAQRRPAFQIQRGDLLPAPCETQEEIDHYWERLSEGGQIQQCGWLKDRFGVSWQIFPAALPEMLRDTDKAKAARATRAMLGMKKLDIAQFRAAYEGAH